MKLLSVCYSCVLIRKLYLEKKNNKKKLHFSLNPFSSLLLSIFSTDISNKIVYFMRVFTYLNLFDR